MIKRVNWGQPNTRNSRKEGSVSTISFPSLPLHCGKFFKITSFNCGRPLIIENGNVYSNLQQSRISRSLKFSKLWPCDNEERDVKLLQSTTWTSLRLWRLMFDTSVAWIISSNPEQLSIINFSSFPRLLATEVGKRYCKLLQLRISTTFKLWRLTRWLSPSCT